VDLWSSQHNGAYEADSYFEFLLPLLLHVPQEVPLYKVHDLVMEWGSIKVKANNAIPYTGVCV